MFVWGRGFLNERGERVTLGHCGGDLGEDWDLGVGGSMEAVMGFQWGRLALRGTVMTLEVRKVALQLTLTFEF